MYTAGISISLQKEGNSINMQLWLPIIQLDTSTARRRLKSPRSLSGTSAHPTMVTLLVVNTMVMNG